MWRGGGRVGGGRRGAPVNQEVKKTKVEKGRPLACSRNPQAVLTKLAITDLRQESYNHRASYSCYCRRYNRLMAAIPPRRSSDRRLSPNIIYISILNFVEPRLDYGVLYQ